jgi:hypothetical protein
MVGMAPGLETEGKGWVRWSNAGCAISRERRPMSPSRAAQTLTNGLVADLFFWDVLASLHLHLEHKLYLRRVTEIQVL